MLVISFTNTAIVKKKNIEGNTTLQQADCNPIKFETSSKSGWNVVEDDCKSLFFAARSVLHSQFEDLNKFKTFQTQTELMNENYKSKTFICLKQEQYMVS